MTHSLSLSLSHGGLPASAHVCRRAHHSERRRVGGARGGGAAASGPLGGAGSAVQRLPVRGGARQGLQRASGRLLLLLAALGRPERVCRARGVRAVAPCLRINRRNRRNRRNRPFTRLGARAWAGVGAWAQADDQSLVARSQKQPLPKLPALGTRTRWERVRRGGGACVAIGPQWVQTPRHGDPITLRGRRMIVHVSVGCCQMRGGCCLPADDRRGRRSGSRGAALRLDERPLPAAAAAASRGCCPRCHGLRRCRVGVDGGSRSALALPPPPKFQSCLVSALTLPSWPTHSDVARRHHRAASSDDLCEGTGGSAPRQRPRDRCGRALIGRRRRRRGGGRCSGRCVLVD
jgi:hypothetical protein